MKRATASLSLTGLKGSPQATEGKGEGETQAPAPAQAAPRPNRSARDRVLQALVGLRAEPRLALLLLNAQAQLRGRTRAPLPLSLRLRGSVRTRGGGEIHLGAGVTIDGSITPVELVATRPGRIEIGAGSFINYGVSISAHESVAIGAGCHIGHYSFIYDNDLHTIDALSRLPPSQPVVLEDRVWLGTRVIVLKGVRIGHDAVIGAGSVVTHDIPAGVVAAGAPARLLRAARSADPPTDRDSGHATHHV